MEAVKNGLIQFTCFFQLTAQMIANNTAQNGEFRLGLKRFHDLCPPKVRESLTNARKMKEWDEPHKIATAEISRKINEFETQNPGMILNDFLGRMIHLCSLQIHQNYHGIKSYKRRT